MVNKERAKRGASPVVFDLVVYHHAKSWSRTMAFEKRLFHSRGKTILENIASNNTGGTPTEITMKMYYQWRGSPPHWDWMMNPQISKAAFAYTKNGHVAYGAYAFEYKIPFF